MTRCQKEEFHKKINADNIWHVNCTHTHIHTHTYTYIHTYRAHTYIHTHRAPYIHTEHTHTRATHVKHTQSHTCETHTHTHVKHTHTYIVHICRTYILIMYFVPFCTDQWRSDDFVQFYRKCFCLKLSIYVWKSLRQCLRQCLVI